MPLTTAQLGIIDRLPKVFESTSHHLATMVEAFGGEADVSVCVAEDANGRKLAEIKAVLRYRVPL